MSIHSASGLEAFLYALNPFKNTVHTDCGETLENPREVPDGSANCSDCNDQNTGSGLFLGIF